MTAQDVGLILCFPSPELAKKSRNALLRSLDPFLATDAKFSAAFMTTFPSTLYFYSGPPKHGTLVSQVREFRTANADITGFGSVRLQDQVSTRRVCVL